MSRKREKNMPERKKRIIIAGSIAGGVLLAYLGSAAFFTGHFYLNTTVNGRDFSGKTVEDVEGFLREEVAGYTLTVREMDGSIAQIAPADVSLAYRDSGEAQNILDGQNPFLWPVSLFEENAETVALNVTYDEEQLAEKIQALPAVTREQVQPTNAYPEYNGESYEIRPEVYGTAVNLDVLTEKITESMSGLQAELDMFQEGCYVAPTYTSESTEVQEACALMNRYAGASITYTMYDGDLTIDREEITGWVRCDDTMQVTLDETAVRQWMREFGQRYDTVGTTRQITTPTGKTVSVSGGKYGWSVNEDAETQAIIQNIQNGETVSREPSYKQRAAAYGAQDWGDTYLEVDLSAQHMWYVKDGSVVFESDVVTGKPSDGRATPKGVYSVLEMQRNRTLRGSIDPSTGKPSYETPVSYWMRITWSGIGFHDASWQSSFGGTRYISHGSHGCINMPPSRAAELYGMLEIGTPAIVHS